LAAGELDPLLGIDLPDLMRLSGAGNLESPWLRPGPARAIDSCLDECVLEGANRWDGLVRELLGQLDTN
jgi:hypothetical protein